MDWHGLESSGPCWAALDPEQPCNHKIPSSLGAGCSRCPAQNTHMLSQELHASFQIHRMPAKEKARWLHSTLAHDGGPGPLGSSKIKKHGVLRIPPSPSLALLLPHCSHFLKFPRFCTLGRSSKTPSTSGLTSCQLGLRAMGSPYFLNCKSPKMKACKRR